MPSSAGWREIGGRVADLPRMLCGLGPRISHAWSIRPSGGDKRRKSASCYSAIMKWPVGSDVKENSLHRPYRAED